MTRRGLRVAVRLALALAMAAGLGACHGDTAPAAASDAPPAVTPPAPAAAGSGSTQASVQWRLPGALRADTDVDELRRLFGATNVRVGQIDGPEGTTANGVTLFADDPQRRALLYFADETGLRGLDTVLVREPTSRWRLDNGVHIGMRLHELLALNGTAVAFSGFDWDYGGTITDWKGGRLAPREGDPVRRGVRLRVDRVAATDHFPSGDTTFMSNDPRYPMLGTRVVVDQLYVGFARADAP